ncbi:MAG: zinc-binding dehydrogenase [Candidatus Kapaibacteriales bacterium]
MAKIQPGDVFFMWGGSSAVGNYAIQLAKKIGSTVITTTGFDWKKEKIYSFGADYVFNHQTENVVEKVLNLFPEGVDAVLDFVGTDSFNNSINMLRKNGKLMVCGMLTGREVNLNIQLFYLKHLQLYGYYLGSLNSFKKLVKMVENGDIKPHIDKIFELKEASEAHKYMEAHQHIGKIVLKA